MGDQTRSSSRADLDWERSLIWQNRSKMRCRSHVAGERILSYLPLRSSTGRHIIHGSHWMSFRLQDGIHASGESYFLFPIGSSHIRYVYQWFFSETPPSSQVPNNLVFVLNHAARMPTQMTRGDETNESRKLVLCERNPMEIPSSIHKYLIPDIFFVMIQPLKSKPSLRFPTIHDPRVHKIR